MAKFVNTSVSSGEIDLLLAKLPPLSPAEIRGQRISFVYGQMMDCSPDVSRAQITADHDEIYGG